MYDVLQNQGSSVRLYLVADCNNDKGLLNTLVPAKKNIHLGVCQKDLVALYCRHLEKYHLGSHLFELMKPLTRYYLQCSRVGYNFARTTQILRMNSHEPATVEQGDRKT
jgi:hypothetical protein